MNSTKRNGKAASSFTVQNRKEIVAQNPLGANGSARTAFMAQHKYSHYDRNRVKEKAVVVRANDGMKKAVDCVYGNNRQLEKPFLSRTVPLHGDHRWKARFIPVRETIKIPDSVGSNQIPHSEVVSCLFNLVNSIAPIEDSVIENGAEHGCDNYSIEHWYGVKNVLNRLQREIEGRINSSQKTSKVKF